MFNWNSTTRWARDSASAGETVFAAYGGGNLSSPENHFSDVTLFKPSLRWGEPGYGQSSFVCQEYVPPEGCAVQARLAVNNSVFIDPAAVFEWSVRNTDTGDTIAQGEIKGSDFSSTAWIMPDNLQFWINGPVELSITQTAGPEYCEFIVGGVVFGADTYYSSGYHDTCFGAPSICYPRFNCNGDLSGCDQG